MRTTTGVGRAVASQSDVYAGPNSAFNGSGTAPGVIYCHGYGNVSFSPTNSSLTGQYPLFTALANQFAVAASDFSNNAWGNSTSVGNVGTTQTWMQSTMGARTGKIALIGVSMGCATALNYAKANPTLVACVVCVLPAININDYATNNTGGYAASVNTAYGGTYTDGSFGATSNPYYYASSFPNIPVHLYYSTADTIALPTFVTGFISNCSSATGTVVSTTLNHGEAAVAAAPLYGTNGIIPFIAGNLA